MKIVRSVGAVLLLSWLLPSHAVTLTFEGLSDATVLTSQIAGYQFENALVSQAGLSLNETEFPPHSGVTAVTDDGGPLEVVFSSPLAFFSAYFTYAASLELRGFDGNGVLLATLNSQFSDNTISSGNLPNELLSLSALGITRIRISGDALGGSFVMDDMTSEPMADAPAPASIMLIALGLFGIRRTRMLPAAGRTSRSLRALPVFLGLSALTFNANASQGFQSISLTPPAVVKNAPTTVTVEAQPFVDTKLLPASLRLHRLVGTQWQVVGTMVDDGSQGDSVAGDGVYTSQITINEASGTVQLRASAGYRGTVLRTQSSVADVNLVDPLELSVSTGIVNVQMTQGEVQNLAYFIHVVNETGAPVQTTITQTVTPTGGLSISSDSPGTFTVPATTTRNMNQVVTANLPGSYQIQVAAAVAGGPSDATVVNVTVLAPGAQAQLLPLGAYPSGIGIGTPSNVLFTISLVGSDGITASPMTLQRLDASGNVIADLDVMVDDGTDGDLAAGDAVYSSTVSLTENAAGTLHFRATANVPGVGTVTSPAFTLEVTPFPVGMAPPLPGKIVTDPDTGEQAVSDELLVSFAGGTTPEEILTIVGTISGTVVGTLPGANLYQVRFPGGGTVQGLYDAGMTLLGDPRVATVKANILLAGNAFPDDPGMSLEQWGPKKVRADEAWLIAKGSAIIAVVDSGIDLNHEDLRDKVIKGHDYVQDDDEPGDENGHGTHVAGIAAASANNTKGVAGIAWDSKILAIRAHDKNGTGPTSSAVAGIREAADKGAKVINASFGFSTCGWFCKLFESDTEEAALAAAIANLQEAVDYAHSKGALVVAAAGNDGKNREFYPAACNHAMAIGSTTTSDSRSGFSNHGGWVTMAAPGSGIYSTSPTYAVTLNAAPSSLSKDYGTLSGTSQATPFVSGAAAVLWSIHPTWTPDQIRERLVASAKPLPGADLGAGRLDLFEAVFNGNFEMGSLDEWTVTGTASILETLGSLSPPDGKKFAFVSTGPGGDNVATTLSHTFKIQPGVTQLPIRFDYNFVSEEYPEFVGTQYNDSLTIVVVAPNGATTTLAAESVNGSNFSAIGGIDFPGGDATVGQTGWRKATANIPATEGPGTYRVFITDAGDDIYDSVVLIDHIELKFFLQ